jgi:hypothetical protein
VAPVSKQVLAIVALRGMGGGRTDIGIATAIMTTVTTTAITMVIQQRQRRKVSSGRDGKSNEDATKKREATPPSLPAARLLEGLSAERANKAR